MGAVQKILKLEPGISLYQWIADRISNNWSPLAMLIGGGAATYVSSITEWVEKWGPIGWAVAFASGSMTVLLASVLISQSLYKASVATYIRSRTNIDSTNTLLDLFRNQKINISDFHNYDFRPKENAFFDGSEIYGPAPVIFLESSLVDCAFINCDFVLVKEDAKSLSSIAFRKCQFNKCSFNRITVLASKKMMDQFRAIGINIITD